MVKVSKENNHYNKDCSFGRWSGEKEIYVPFSINVKHTKDNHVPHKHPTKNFLERNGHKVKEYNFYNFDDTDLYIVSYRKAHSSVPLKGDSEEDLVNMLFDRKINTNEGKIKTKFKQFRSSIGTFDMPKNAGDSPQQRKSARMAETPVEKQTVSKVLMQIHNGGDTQKKTLIKSGFNKSKQTVTKRGSDPKKKFTKMAPRLEISGPPNDAGIATNTKPKLKSKNLIPSGHLQDNVSYRSTDSTLHVRDAHDPQFTQTLSRKLLSLSKSPSLKMESDVESDAFNRSTSLLMEPLVRIISHE